MDTNLLLPHTYRSWGWKIFIPSSILGLFVLFTNVELDWLGGKVFVIYAGSGIKLLTHTETGQFFTFVSGNYTQTIVGVLCLMSLMMIAFSKEKTEDEFIWASRLNALLWATYINYFVLIFCFIFFFGFEFLYIMIFNMFTTLILFIARFHYILLRQQKTMRNEE